MNLLFSEHSLIILESLSFTKALYVFDFDGTLSKIVRVPSEATITQVTDDLLKQLSCLVPVAVVSGRSINDLRERLKYKPQYLVGNHGLEGLIENRGSLKEAQVICQKWKLVLEKIKFGSGVEIEDKVYSLAIHYRRSRNKKSEKTFIKEMISKLVPNPRVVPGKSVFNLLPPGAPHKGVAVLELMKQIGANHVFYIGDDDTDEDVFSLSEPKIMTVRVGYKKSSQAQFYIPRQTDINKLIKIIINQYQSEKSV